MNHCIDRLCQACGHEYCLRCFNSKCPLCKQSYTNVMKIDTPLSLKADIAQLMNRIAVLEVEIDVASQKGHFTEVEQKRRDLHVLEYKLQVKKSQLHPTNAKPAFDCGVEILM